MFGNLCIPARTEIQVDLKEAGQVSGFLECSCVRRWYEVVYFRTSSSEAWRHRGHIAYLNSVNLSHTPFCVIPFELDSEAQGS